MKDICKEISFDGIKFWYRDIPIGKPSQDLDSNTPKELMQKEKLECLGKITGDI